MRKQHIFWLVFSVMFIYAFSAFAQQPAQPPQYRQEAASVTVHQISPHVYEVRGGDGANSAFIVGENEVYAVDAKMSRQSAEDVVAAIKKTTDKPMTHILVTHSDGDHVIGLVGFPDSLDIVAHVNSAKHMVAANETAEEKMPLPNEIFHNQMQMAMGDLKIDLLYFGPAHTDGDVVIYIPEDEVAIIGDLFFNDRDPLIHMHKNGNSSGLASVLGKIIELDAKTFLSGHAEPVSKDEIEDLHEKIIETRKNVKAMVDGGKSLDEVKKAMGISTEPSRWKSLAEVVYLELTE